MVMLETHAQMRRGGGGGSVCLKNKCGRGEGACGQLYCDGAGKKELSPDVTHERE